MSQLLRGNFTARNEVKSKKTEEDLSTKFERTALAQLGGSIAYVSRKTFLWNGEDDTQGRPVVGRAAQYDAQNATPPSGKKESK
jgi:hypothetical protein